MNSELARQINLLVFEVGSRRIAVDASVVRQVIAAVAITALPKGPPIIEGLVDYHGTVIPVLDIRQRFGVAPSAITPSQHFVIATAGDRLVGLRVDRATDVIEVEQTAIDSSGSSIPGVEYAHGVVKRPDGLLIIHDLRSFLSLEEEGMLEGAMRQAGDTAGALARGAV